MEGNHLCETHTDGTIGIVRHYVDLGIHVRRHDLPVIEPKGWKKGGIFMGGTKEQNEEHLREGTNERRGEGRQVGRGEGTYHEMVFVLRDTEKPML